jgi:hypothetical protein
LVDNGWTVDVVTGPEELRREGELMRNCLSRYHSVDWFEVLSLRDPRGRPRVNIGVVDGMLVHGPEAKARRPLSPREQGMVDEFLDVFGIDPAPEQVCVEERRALDTALESFWYSADVLQEEAEGRLGMLLRRIRGYLPFWMRRPVRGGLTDAAA